MSLQEEVKYLDHLKEDSDQPLDKDSILNSPHSTAKHGTELVVTVHPIKGEGDAMPEKRRTERNKFPTKRPHSAPVDAGPHKKTKKPDPPQGEKVAGVLLPVGADPPRDPPDPKDPKGPKKDPPKDPVGGPPGGGKPPPGPPPDPPKAPVPKRNKMGTSRPSMKDIPLYKEGDDPIAFITLFTSYLNYYDIDLTTTIPKAGNAGYVDAETSAKECKKHYTDPKTLLGRALQG